VIPHQDEDTKLTAQRAESQLNNYQDLNGNDDDITSPLVTSTTAPLLQ
jgi:hypothetical protein